MAGRLVTFYDRIQLSSSDDNTYIAQYVMPSDVRWRCTTICGYESTWQPYPSNGNEFAVVQLHVNQTAVFEARLVSANRADSLLVLPWGDGLRFSAGEQAGWFASFLGGQGVWSATFIGARE